MKPRRFVVFVLVTVFGLVLSPLSSVHAATPASGLVDYTITVDGYQRTYHVHLPRRYHGKTRLPLVVVLHGSDSSGPNMASMTHFNDVANSNDVIATYPDAINGIWNTDGSAPQDDIAFLSAMIQQMRSTFLVNPRRIYAMGFSNGAEMTEEFGCKQGVQLAAIASVSGHMPSTFHCPLVHSMPLITMHGTADPIYPYAGWADTKFSQHFMGAVDAETKWASLSSCTGAPVTSDLPDAVPTDGTTEQLTVTGGCAGGAEIQLYTIINGGHTWPGGLQYAPVSQIGLTSLDIDASTLIWQFFAPYQN